MSAPSIAELRSRYPALSGGADTLVDSRPLMPAAPGSEWVALFMLISALLPMLDRCIDPTEDPEEAEEAAFRWLTRWRLISSLRDRKVRAAAKAAWTGNPVIRMLVAESVVEESRSINRYDFGAMLREAYQYQGAGRRMAKAKKTSDDPAVVAVLAKADEFVAAILAGLPVAPEGEAAVTAAGRDPQNEAYVKALISRYLFLGVAGAAAASPRDPGVGAVAMQIYTDFLANWEKYVTVYYAAKG